jgi:hypothetical protein
METRNFRRIRGRELLNPGYKQSYYDSDTSELDNVSDVSFGSGFDDQKAAITESKMGKGTDRTGTRYQTAEQRQFNSDHVLRPADAEQVRALLAAAKKERKPTSDCENSSSSVSFSGIPVLSESTVEDLEDAVPGAQVKSLNSTTFNEPCRKPITAATPVFSAILVPVTSRAGGIPSMTFTYRVRDDLCVLQWTDFEGLMASSGTSTISVPQSIYPLPSSSIRSSVSILYRGIERQGWARIDPQSPYSLSFSLGVPPEQVQLQDSFTIHGGNMQWIPDTTNCCR